MRPEKSGRATGKIRIRGARANNLGNVTVDLPLGGVTAVTGPSGSGKSTLCVDVLYPALARHLGNVDVPFPGAHDAVTGLSAVKHVELVDQSPLGRTSRGNAATYTGAWNRVRALFAAEPAAKAAHFGPAHFSFNVEGGRCDCVRRRRFRDHRDAVPRGRATQLSGMQRTALQGRGARRPA